ncbi:hypothetical protein ACLK1T_20350 [Escherichia coli]
MLTVRAGQAHCLASLGWETFTDKLISLINQHREGVVFCCGNCMRKRKGRLNKQRHHVLKAPHPSPLFGASWILSAVTIFVLANRWLEQHGETPIDWMPVLPGRE